VFGNRVLRISRCELEEVAGGWRGLQTGELHNLYRNRVGNHGLDSSGSG
jgi:hypothetical protein